VLQVTVTETNRQKTFYIARNLVDQKAPRLKDSTDLFDDGPVDTLDITDTSIETVELVVKWLNWDANQNVSMLHPLCLLLPPHSGKGVLSVAKTYIFAEACAIPKLCSEALLHIARFTERRLRVFRAVGPVFFCSSRNWSYILLEINIEYI
jgi:hypothetical protein